MNLPHTTGVGGFVEEVKKNQQQSTKKQKKIPSGFNENAQRSGYDRMTGVKNVRSFLSSYLEKDNSLVGHHLLVGE